MDGLLNFESSYHWLRGRQLRLTFRLDVPHKRISFFPIGGWTTLPPLEQETTLLMVGFVGKTGFDGLVSELQQIAKP